MGWLTGWAKRKSHVLNSATGAGTGYQVKITAYKTTGVDANGSVYLGTNVRDDFGDVRFTDDNGTTLLDYWMESLVSGVSAVFWVEVADSLESVSQTIYIYYKYDAITTTSNGPNTFPLLFDHFDAASLDDTIWVTPQVHASISSSKVTLQDDNGIWQYLETDATFGAGGVAMRCKAQITGRNSNTGVDITFNTTGGNSRVDILYFATLNLVRCIKNGTGSSANSNVDTNENIYEMDWISDHVHYFINDVEMTGSPITSNVPTVALKVSFQNTNASGQTSKVIVDWVLVRKYVHPEPVHSTWGSEENVPSLKAGMSIVFLAEEMILG